MNYIEKKYKLIEVLNKLIKLSTELNFTSIVEKSNQALKRIMDDKFIITIVGEFNTGKSTLLNTILGIDIIPTAIKPTTATINIIHYGEKPAIKVHKKNNEIIDIAFNKDALKEYTALSEFDSASVKYLEIIFPVEYLKDGIVLVDTPGVEDINEQRTEITYGYIPVSDATIILFDAKTPFKKSEKRFLKDHILENKIPTLFYVINHIDLLESGLEIDESVDYIKKELTELLGTNSLNIFPISAKQALDSVITNNKELEELSRFPIFEDQLREFILGSERANSKLESIKNQLSSIGQLILAEISAEEQQLGKSLKELEEMKTELSSSKDKYYNVFSKLLTYIDEQRDSLLARVEGSLLKKYKEVKEDIEYRVDRSKGDLADLAEKDIPYIIRQSLKKWFEQSEPFITQNYNVISQKAVDGYIKYFSKRPLLNRISGGDSSTAIADIESIFIGDGSDVNNISKYTLWGGAIVAGVITTIVTGGLGLYPIMIGYAGGKILQRDLGGSLMKKKYEKQKAELTRIFPGALSAVFENFRLSIRNRLDNNFKSLKQSLEGEYSQTIKSLESNINSKIKNYEKEKGSAEEKQIEFNNAKNQLTELAKL